MDEDINKSPKSKRGRSRSRSPVRKRKSSADRERSPTDRKPRRLYSRDRDSRKSRSRSATPENVLHNIRHLFVSNIAFDAKWVDLAELFLEKVGSDIEGKLFRDDLGKSRGCGIIECETPEMAEKAIRILHKYEFKGRRLIVSMDLECKRDEFGRPITYEEAELEEQKAKPVYETYGLTPKFLESLEIYGPLNNRLFVSNLDDKVSLEKLKEVFAVAGDVLKAEIETDKKGKSHASVFYEHPLQAVQAVSMLHARKLYGRRLSVRIYRKEREEEEERSKIPEGLEGVGEGLGRRGRRLDIRELDKKYDRRNRLRSKTSSANEGMGGTRAAAGVASEGVVNASVAKIGLQAVSGLSAANMKMLAPLATAIGLMRPVGTMGNAGVAASTVGIINPVMATAGQSSNIPLTAVGAKGKILTRGGIGGLGNTGVAATRGASTVGIINPVMATAGQSSRNPLTAMGTTGKILARGGIDGRNVAGLGATGVMPASIGSAGVGTNIMGGVGRGIPGIGSVNFGATGVGAVAVPSGISSGAVSSGGLGDYAAGSFYYRPSKIVIVRNIPESLTWKDLRDRFKEIGEVCYMEMKNKESAVVHFTNEFDAQKAIEKLNGKRIDGQSLEVSFFY